MKGWNSKEKCTITIAGISNDSVMKMDKKNYPQVYLEECKMVKFIDAELDLDDSDDSLDSNAE